jgi:transcriptional regulator with XRE-family HTH domain
VARRIFDHVGVRERRIAAGLTAEQVAVHIRRTKGQVDNLEAGRSQPSVFVLLGLAEILDCTADALFIDEPQPATLAA